MDTRPPTHPLAPVMILDRREISHRAGATLAEIVDDATPDMPPAIRSDLRVVLVTATGADVVPSGLWHRVRPRPGVRVVIRSVPTGNAWRSILMIVVTIAAISLGQLWGAALGEALHISAGLATSLITVGVGAIGMLLINALIPVRKDEKEYGGFSINGWKNTSNPDGPVPAPLGRLRMAPYYAAPPWTEIVGDIQYQRAAFVWGYGPLTIADLKIGDTALSEYDEVQIEHRHGWSDDEQLTLYTQQVIEEGLSIDLTRPWPRNDDGSYREAPVDPDGGSGGGTGSGGTITTIEKPQVRYTATDIAQVGVILGFPTGLCAYDDDGNRQNYTVTVRIRQRRLGETAWIDVALLSVVAAKGVPFWRSHRWELPARGAYEIELTRMTDETKSSRVTDRVVWQALQSIRPEYPFAFDAPVALTAMRVKATEQLNGTIDGLTGVVGRVAPDWDVTTSSWITRETRSPAAALRWVLQGPAAAYPVADTGIDLALLADWSAWCAAKGLHYDKVHDAEESIADALLAVAHAGRATPRHDGLRWGVVIDRPSDLVVDHINPRNSRDFKWTRTYPRHPDGFRVKFQDASWDHKPSERLVPWPGHVGDIVVTEQLELPGKCDPDEIWIEARRRMYEIIHRPDAFEVTQDGMARVATRGDVVAVSHDALVRTQTAGRVATVVDALVELDEEIDRTGAGDGGWAIRFRVFAGASDVIGSSVVRRIAPFEGRSKIVRLLGSGASPTVGDLVHVGPATEESLLCVVRSEERGEDGAVIYHLVAAAPEIDELTDAEEPPAWNGRAGSTYIGTGTATAPDAPIFDAVATGVAGTGSANGLVVRLRAGSGSPAIVYRFEIDHRKVGATTWTPLVIPASDGGAAIGGYVKGDAVQLRARSISLYGIEGPFGAVVSVTIGEDDVVVPDVTGLRVTHPGSGIRTYAIETESSTVTIAGWRIRARPGSGWSWADLSPLHTGLVVGTPWSAPTPISAGSWTVAAVAVAGDGTESSHPFEVVSALPALWDTGVVADRIETALGWPGTITGGSVVAGGLVGSSAGTPLVYTLPTIDLGSDVAVSVDAACYGVVGAAAVAMRVGASVDGAPVGAAVPLGTATARYVAISVTVTAPSTLPRLGDVASLVRTL